VKPRWIRKEAVRDVSLDIQMGESVGLVGANGAGKTTLMKMMAGLLHPSSGQIEVLGYKPFERKPEFLRQIGMVMGQKSQLWLDIPAWETYDLLASIYQVKSPIWQTRVESLSQLFQVKDQLKVPVRRLSLGERMKLEIIAALLHKPRLLILDEPTIGLDVVARRNIRAFIKDYVNQEDTTLLLSSHDMSDISELCPRLMLLSQGQLSFDGKLREFEKLHPQSQNKKVSFYFESGALASTAPWESLATQHLGRLEQQDPLSPVFVVPQENLAALIQKVLTVATPLDLRIEESSLEAMIHATLEKA
jgi:ABC-2 type transport system ATP-binding protein